MIDRIEYSITDNCNLNCAYCCHYAPIATKYFVRLDKFEDDIAQLAFLTNQGKDLGTLGLLGGEPLLHPDLIEMCYHARIMLPYSRIRITTNGLLLKNCPNQTFVVYEDLMLKYLLVSTEIQITLTKWLIYLMNME